MPNNAYLNARGQNLRLLRKLSKEDILELGRAIGINQGVLDFDPGLTAELAAEAITDSPELGKFIPKKYFDGSK